MRNLVCCSLAVVAGCFYHSDNYGGGGGGGGGGGHVDAGPSIDAPDAPPPCVPLSCSDAGASCGIVSDDGCGHPLDCGACVGAAQCGGQGHDDVCAVPPSNRQTLGGWTWESPAPFPWQPADVFARSATDVWAVGGPLVQHFDGVAWSLVDVPTTANLHGVWMASATDGWIVGDGGTLLRWNGTKWTAVASGTTTALSGVHGASATNVWFVGPGASRKWNGSAVVAAATGTVPQLQKVFVSSAHVFAYAAGANIYENIAGVWTKQVAGTSGSFFSGIAGNAAGTSVFCVGGDDPGIFQSDIDWVYQWDGTQWKFVDEPGVGEYWDAWSDGNTVFASTEADVWTMATMATQPGPPIAMRGPVASAGGEVFTLAAGSGAPYHFHGGSWESPPPTYTVGSSSLAIENAAAIGDAMWFASGGSLVEWNHGGVVHQVSGSPIDSIAGTSRQDVWATDDSHQVALHFDGRHWSAIDAPAGGSLRGMFASTGLTLGFGDSVYRWGVALDGGGAGSGSGSGTIDAGAPPAPTWQPETLPAAATWIAAAPVGATGDVVMVGNDLSGSTAVPRVMRRASATGAWTAMTAPTMTTVCAVAARAANDVWVSGYDPDGLYDSGAIAHWDGAKWTVTKPAGAKAWCSLAYAANGDLWAAPKVGDDEGGIVHHLVSGAWQSVPAVYGGEVRTVAFDSAGVLWAGGDDSAILHR